MYINITDSEKGNNKDGSGELVHYLDKENRLFDQLKPEDWFNGTTGNIPSHQVSRSLDNNIAKLSRDDAKFFLINISPSQKEITYLKERYGEEIAKEKLKEYAVKVMDEYARNFNRPGIESNRDLLWFAKLENHRYYTHKDPEVKNGTIKRGTVKPGEQMHIQVIVSRKDITNKIKLSPEYRDQQACTACGQPYCFGKQPAIHDEKRCRPPGSAHENYERNQGRRPGNGAA